MKKTYLILAALLLLGVCAANAQTVSSYSLGDRLTQKIDVFRINAWTPFTSDSLTTARSATFDIAQYDSLKFWVKSTSVAGAPKFWGYVFGSFDGTNFDDSLSIGKAIDTADTKLEVLNYCTIVPTHGALKARLSVTGSSVTTANEKDCIVTVYIVGYKRTEYYR
jgi:hypothetical protein